MLLFLLYMIIGYIMFKEDIREMAFAILESNSISEQIFILLDLVIFWVAFPVEIIINNYGGREVWNAIVLIMFSPFLVAVMAISIFWRILIEIIRDIKYK